MYRRANDDEERLISQLLRHPFPGSAELREQFKGLRVRSLDSNGSLALSTSVDVLAPVKLRIPVEAECVDADGVPVHVLLHVVNGMLKELEIFREDSGPLIVPVNETTLEIVSLE
jgi:hypothetical protein